MQLKMSKIHNAYIKFKYKYQQFLKRRKLRYRDLCIISNNCWAGTAVYQPFGLKYNTPTVGLFIMDDDYIEFLENLDFYLAQPLRFVPLTESKYRDTLFKDGERSVNYPLAILDDKVEIHFLHYKSESEAAEKWQRRKLRINKKRLLIKWSLRYSSHTNDTNIERFLNLPFKNKVAFVPSSCKMKAPELVIIPELDTLNIVGGDETETTLKRISLIELLNSLK